MVQCKKNNPGLKCRDLVIWLLMEGQYERVSQSRELLYSVPAALCEEIARAATEELAERLSIPD